MQRFIRFDVARWLESSLDWAKEKKRLERHIENGLCKENVYKELAYINKCIKLLDDIREEIGEDGNDLLDLFLLPNKTKNRIVYDYGEKHSVSQAETYRRRDRLLKKIERKILESSFNIVEL